MPAIGIGFVGFGEAASVLSRILWEHGATITAYDALLDVAEDGAARLRERARNGGIEFVSLRETIERSDYVLSTVTTSNAAAAAASCVPFLKRGQVFVDLNSTAPGVKIEIARIVARSGADFVEGAILGPVGATGAATRILTAGEKGAEAARILGSLGLRVSFFTSEIGKASTFKMLRSVFSKGLEALLLEMLIAGKRANMEPGLWQDVTGFVAENLFDEVAANWIRTHATACERRHDEMSQVVQTLRELGIDPLMSQATEAFFGRSRSLGLKEAFPQKPESAEPVIDFMEQRLAGK